MGILGVIILCVISAICYRAGGMGKEATANPTWMPMAMRKSWVRDWLCPMMFLITILQFYRPSYLMDYVYILVYYGATGGAMSTYWDFLFHEVDNYYAHGFVIGLAGFALITFVPWWILTLRLIICTLGMGYFSKIIEFDELEEEVRGVFFIL